MDSIYSRNRDARISNCHLSWGLDQLNKSSNEREQNVNEAEKLMQTLGVIDLLITGHQHQTFIGKDEKLYMFKLAKMQNS